MPVFTRFVCLIALVISAVPALGVNWTGGGDGVNWSDASNWDGDPTGATINVDGAFTVTVDVDDSINSLRIGEGAQVTIPAGVTLSDIDISEPSGLGWWSGASSELIVEGTFAFGDNSNNMWLSDGFNSGPSILRVRGNGVLDTLAAAYAAAGNFSEAIKTAEKALKIAQEANMENLADEIGKHLELYKSGRPLRE